MLEIESWKLLLDLGDELERGERPDLSQAGTVDAVILSHAHVDHVGALDRLNEIGMPPVYASARTFHGLPDGYRPKNAHILPEPNAEKPTCWA
ncbi:MAG: MBL fold metallo-hydrolase [Breoghania sp.]|nr:MBL fold metallo-hydrolase [Breoghania sp.]MDJ0930554.1 MBL fold metallo-hydrolase [Breoghania sp.]